MSVYGGGANVSQHTGVEVRQLHRVPSLLQQPVGYRDLIKVVKPG